MVTLLIGGDSIGKLAKATGGASRTVADLTTDAGDAEAYADAFQATFNAEADTIRRYVNDRFDADETVMAIRFADREGGHSERYVLADVEGSATDFEEMRAVAPDRFDELDRSVDRRVVIDWHLSRNAADELRAFVDRFATAGEDPSPSYVAKTAATYGDSFEGDLFAKLVDRYE